MPFQTIHITVGLSTCWTFQIAVPVIIFVSKFTIWKIEIDLLNLNGMNGGFSESEIETEWIYLFLLYMCVSAIANWNQNFFRKIILFSFYSTFLYCNDLWFLAFALAEQANRYWAKMKAIYLYSTVITRMRDCINVTKIYDYWNAFQFHHIQIVDVHLKVLRILYGCSHFAYWNKLSNLIDYID